MKKVVIILFTLFVLVEANAQLSVPDGINFSGAFAADPNYYENNNFISFSHTGISEDFIGYKNNTFYFMDALGGGDTQNPNLHIGGKLMVNGLDATFYSGTTTNTISVGRSELERFKLHVTDNIGYLDYIQDLDEGGGHVFYIRNMSEGTSANNDIRFQTSSQDRLTIKANGNIGVGTNNPYSTLDIAGDLHLIGSDVSGGWRKNHFYYGGHSLIIGTKPGNFAHNLLELKPGGCSQGEIYSGMRMYYAESENQHHLRVQIHTSLYESTFFNAGPVGIGTNNPSPDAKLTVGGLIRAREIKVEANAGADFVFEEDYNLMPLNELETFVKTKKHLPEVAPAKEMEAEGLSISEMNIKLLQKIEELTLYTIEQEKTIEKLLEKGQRQDAIVKELIMRIENLENIK